MELSDTVHKQQDIMDAFSVPTTVEILGFQDRMLVPATYTKYMYRQFYGIRGSARNVGVKSLFSRKFGAENLSSVGFRNSVIITQYWKI